MKVSRININGTETLISLGIDESEVERNELRDEDTLELDKIVKEASEIINGQN